MTERPTGPGHRTAGSLAHSGSAAAAIPQATHRCARWSSGTGQAGPTARSCGGRSAGRCPADVGTPGSDDGHRLCRHGPCWAGAAGGRWASGSPGCRPARPRTWSSRWRWPHSGSPIAAAHRAHRPGAARTHACRDRPGLRRSGPPLTARRLKESTLTRSRSIRPAAPSSSNSSAWSWSNTPVRAHSSSRRQQVVAEPQPSSLAGSRLHGVEVRAMKMTAARQLRSGRGGERRRGSGVVGLAAAAGRAAIAPRAAVGPRDWSWAGASQHQPDSLKQPYRQFRNVHLLILLP
jgi:hypothetical protein